MSRFEIEIAGWLQRDFGDPVERLSLAEIVIRVGGVAITEVEDSEARTTRKGIRVSAPVLAEWLVANWWRLRWEADGEGPSWRLSHEIGAAGNGYLWPDAMFVSSGGALRIRARPTRLGDSRSLRFLNGVDEDVPARDFENGVRDFVEAVISRTGSVAARTVDASLSTAWRELGEEIGDTTACFDRAIEARLGYDPGEAPPDLSGGLRRAADMAGRDALGELAVSSGRHVLQDFNKLWSDGRRRSRIVPLEIAPTLRQAVERARHASHAPWKQGVAAARSARREWFRPGDPLLTDDLADLCGAPREWIQEPAAGDDAPIPAGFRDAEGEGQLSIVLKKRHPVSRRFALARAIGDHLAIGERENLLPVTDSHTDRQKFQRAFAQEFLCPIEALRDALGTRRADDEFILDSAVRFEVSSHLVAYALENNGLLDRSAPMRLVA